MRLTRRDALLAMVGGGAVASLSLYEMRDLLEGIDRPGAERTDVLLAVTDVIYPSSVEVTSGYVDGYVAGVSTERADAIDRTAAGLDRLSVREMGSHFPDASVARRDRLLRHLGVDRVGSDPDGTLAERVRYHLVNSLLYLLFTSPQGSRLVGIDNPVGHPGGLASYQQPP